MVPFTIKKIKTPSYNLDNTHHVINSIKKNYDEACIKLWWHFLGMGSQQR